MSTGLGFVFVSSLVMVTAVDPYSGLLASAATVQSFDIDQIEYQQLKVVPLASNSFDRGEFELVDGANAVKLIVKNAPIPDSGTAKDYALQTVTSKGWEFTQFSCLVKLWERESNWRWNATNKSSGAYGIPQSLPASKMASAGSDWRTNPETQIKWGIGYIDGRYGSPCAALAHSDEHNWY
ncbi:MAG: lytic transglycosylase domain-containing protein [Aquiluna sp.]|nr:lytic transglycosylase domain-containing protein [Aquiluna sp.]